MTRTIAVFAVSGLVSLLGHAAAGAVTNETAGGSSGPDAETRSVDDRLRAIGSKLGAPVLVRIFKAESQLELWVAQDERYVRLKTYRICRWAGKLGPKLAEGDKQSPEGFYVVSKRQVGASSRWDKVVNIGFPNNLDESLGRTGSQILLHGGCGSRGCFAMTDRSMDEIYRVVSATLSKKSIRHIPIHIYPFRMTQANMAKHQGSPWLPFWRDLKRVHDRFESAHRPPKVLVCNKRYLTRQARLDLLASRDGNLTCSPLRASRGQVAHRIATRGKRSRGRSVPWQPWGVHLSADFSRAKALRFYAEIRRKYSGILGNRRPLVVRKVNYSFGTLPRHNVVLGEPTRAKAQKLCARLRKAGGLCLVVKN